MTREGLECLWQQRRNLQNFGTVSDTSNLVSVLSSVIHKGATQRSQPGVPTVLCLPWARQRRLTAAWSDIVPLRVGPAGALQSESRLDLEPR